jgi:hypothetical protein
MQRIDGILSREDATSSLERMPSLKKSSLERIPKAVAGLYPGVDP